MPSLGLGAAGLLVSIITALLLPGKIYEYITTAAGILILYNWAFIIISSFKTLKNTFMNKLFAWIGLLLLLAGVAGTLFEKHIRPGFYASLLVVVLIGIASFIMRKKVWKKNSPGKATS